MSSRSADSLAARLMLLAGTAVIVVLMLAMFEGVLRVVGIGDPDASQASRLKYQQVFLPILVPGERPDGTPVFHTRDPRLPYQSVLREKPQDGLRVVVFGGSATAGLGYSPNVTFARHLERMLQLALPGREVEVVNLGIVALSSKQVVVLVEDVAANLSPDFMIVYSGNNEFLEIHAEKYASKNATAFSWVVDLAAETNLYRALTRVAHGGPETPSMAGNEFSSSDLRVSENEIIQDVKMTPDEIAEVIDGYEANVRGMVAAAKRHGTPLLMLSVASNWEWRGHADLPDDWAYELTGSNGGGPGPYRKALSMIGEQLEDTSDLLERHDLMFKRASAHRRLGDHDTATAEFRAAMNADPHLRRALDAANERVARAAEQGDVPFLDMVESLAAWDEHGMVGFEQFYDYVHFTPEGVVWAAADILRMLEREAWVSPSEGFDLESYVAARLAEIDAMQEDFLAVYEWHGIGFDASRLRDRNLWKYDEMVIELDELLEREPENFRALVYRGNAHFFRVDGAEQAAADYRAALAIEDHPTVRSNLEILLAQRAP